MSQHLTAERKKALWLSLIPAMNIPLFALAHKAAFFRSPNGSKAPLSKTEAVSA
jgi:hypothetical protein